MGTHLSARRSDIRSRFPSSWHCLISVVQTVLVAAQKGRSFHKGAADKPDHWRSDSCDELKKDVTTSPNWILQRLEASLVLPGLSREKGTPFPLKKF